jgi:hypothetical protein
LYKEHGAEWAVIARQFENRGRNNVKARFTAIQRKMHSNENEISQREESEAKESGSTGGIGGGVLIIPLSSPKGEEVKCE